MKTALGLINIFMVTVIFVGIAFFAWSGLIWVVCWGFNYPFSFKLAIGSYVAFLLLSSIFKGKK